ncbi:cellulose binding domain-containing protein [Sphaerisporangium sp. NPDC051017]|uniref:cellulose binding domain-containing protein n=1 Tax=Sphaerisporangium sp. NPDC051017 TaxID=3154636 RepID=UPI0034141CD1
MGRTCTSPSWPIIGPRRSNNGTAALNGWTTAWTLQSGTTINTLWNGVHTVSGSNITVKNADYNRTIPGGGTTTFGYVASGTPGTPTLTCTSP